jgi:hypothetical protein
MKKLLIISLLSSALMANANLKTDLKDVGSQFAEVALAPARAVKNVIVENEIDQDFVDVVSAYPKFFVEQAQEAKEFTKETVQKIADSRFVANVKDASTKAVNATKKAGTKVKTTAIEVGDAIKDVATQTGDAIKDVANKTGNTIKTTATKIANSDEVDDVKNVGAQFAAVPFEFWAAVKAAGKAFKNEIW